MQELILKENTHSDYITKNLDLIQNQNKLNDTDLKNFAIQCKRTGLDPITRQIYAMPSGGKMTIMASIDGLRLIADRSGLYEGQTSPMWCGADGKWVDVWLSKEVPAAAKIGVHKKNFKEPLYAIALFDEYASYKDSKLTFMWNKMPALMIAKVAEALALRKAFPNEMSGVYATEEIQNENINETKEANKPLVLPATPLVSVNKNQNADILEVNYNDLQNYVIKIGKKYIDRKISEVNTDELKNYADWLKSESDKKQKPLTGFYQEFYDVVYLIINQTNEPKFNADEKMEF